MQVEAEAAADSLPIKAERSSYFHVLAKPTGAVCNLDCTYCFFLSKQSLYPDSDFRMHDDLLEVYIRQLLESQPERVQIAWQGGEPTLMGVDFFERMIALVAKYRRLGQQVEHSIQTNGTRLDDEPGLNYLCAGYKMFFEHVDRPMPLMKRLLDAERAPVEITQWYAVQDEGWRARARKLGRNEPCSCGSGRKAKQCHARG